MTQTTDYDIVGSYNNQRISSIDAERTVNMFEYIDPLGKKAKTLINTSGLTNTGFTFGAASGGVRQEFVFNNIHYIVVANQLYKITAPSTVSFVGSLNTNAGYVGMDANTFQVIIVDGVNGYIVDTVTGSFTVITDSSFASSPLDVCYLD